MAGRFQPQADDGPPEAPANNLFGALLVTFFCFPPFGLIAIYWGLRVAPKFKKGDEEGAQHASDMAERWTYAACGVFMLMLFALIGFRIFLFFFGPKSGVPSNAGK
jgi:hypothetical protein